MSNLVTLFPQIKYTSNSVKYSLHCMVLVICVAYKGKSCSFFRRIYSSSSAHLSLVSNWVSTLHTFHTFYSCLFIIFSSQRLGIMVISNMVQSFTLHSGFLITKPEIVLIHQPSLD